MTIDNLALRIADFILTDLESMNIHLEISENVRYTWADEIVRQFELYYNDTIDDDDEKEEDDDDIEEDLEVYKVDELDEIDEDEERDL